MTTKKCCAIGHFGFGETLLNGQTIKTKIVTEQIETTFGENEISKKDTMGGFATLIRLPFVVLNALKKHQNIVIFPAQNGLRIIAPILVALNKFFGRKLHYVVIGGWLASTVENKKLLKKQLEKFDGIYVETTTMKKALEQIGFDNIYLMPNCKPLDILDQDQLVYPKGEPYKLCTFSRVMKEKGIEDAIKAIKTINEKYEKVVYTLDIYGQVDDLQQGWFNKVKSNFPEYVSYGGAVDFDRSVEVLKNYFALLFPTRFFTEGIPGTIIDAYAAGVPVISAKWESFGDMVKEGKTGIGYKFGKPKKLMETLESVYLSKDEFTKMKTTCLEEAKGYLPESAIKVLTNNF